ncbi:F-BAR and double SH3 domains protein 2 isoform X2 [Alosa sapidissima]|uniref:F-BAR and double SH3 domains protein 2 isoform X2 n=1 Tax=Alosa sapidissima TaxID=34773 RepID=UPI001C0A3F5D|nr:F-BAR and double SH3 domains protein 2 isoform X2 [Alosa sapidissima]
MQPPPRKVKVTQELKHTHTEQMSRLHIKHQADCDLLEDLRTYSQKKAILEKDYAQALHKLASQYLKRDWPAVQSENKEHRHICTVWKAYLEGMVQVTQSRLNDCDSYRSHVCEPIKTFRLHKEQQLKRCVEQLTRIQAELQDTVKDLTKTRKKYQETEQMAQAVREKADMEARSKLSLFQSRSSLKRASVKLKAKRNECNSNATHARNDYLLMLAAANAHQDRYYETDLINCINVLDGSIHDHVKSYLLSLCQTELSASQAIHNTFSSLLDKSNQVMHDYHQTLFIQENTTFQKAPPLQFQPCESDSVRHLLKEMGTAEEHSLNKEARKWATRVAREHKNIIHNQRTLAECESAPPSNEQSNNELELKMEEAKESIRKAETVKLKAEARLNMLREVGVVVDTWLKSAMNQVMEELENERWASLNTHDASLSGTADSEREDDEDAEDTEALDDSSSSPSSTLRSYPLTCKVLYSYKASQPDELTIEEQEVLEVIDDGDMEDWVKAKNRAGQVGYVPEKYLQLPSSNSLMSMLQSLAALDTRSHSSSNSTEQEPDVTVTAPSNAVPNGDASAVTFAKALYDYEAQTQDELTFPEGAIIRILSRNEDDGFWEGEFNGRVGAFPAVLVEDLTAVENGEVSPWGADLQVCICTNTHTHTHVHTHTHTHIYAHTHAHTHVHASLRMETCLPGVQTYRCQVPRPSRARRPRLLRLPTAAPSPSAPSPVSMGLQLQHQHRHRYPPRPLLRLRPPPTQAHPPLLGRL